MTPHHPDGTAPADVPVGARPDAPTLRTVPHAHAALRAERVRVGHWRRLVRARMDVAAAAVAVPEPLGGDVFGVLPDDAPDAPSHLALLDAVSTGGPEGEIDRLEALRTLDERLARYELTVTRALHAAVGAGLPRQAGVGDREPGGHRPGPGPMGQTVPVGRDPRHS